jgi:hypothetical protein
MSKITSSSSDLTINADASTSDIKFTIDDVEKASISSAGAFTSTTIDATKLTGNLPALNAASLTSVPAANLTGSLPAGMGGKVLQVVTSRLGAHWASSSTSWVDVTSMSATITPTSSTSKILVTVMFGRITTNQSTGDQGGAVRVLRDNSDDVTINGDAAGSRMRGMITYRGEAYNAGHAAGGYGNQALDTPTIPSTPIAIVYKVQNQCQDSTKPTTINGVPNDTNEGAQYATRTQSSITLMEIAG